MPIKPWKRFEQDVARIFEGQRVPCSGITGSTLKADVLHEKFFIECKARENIASVEWLRETVEKAKPVKKIPVLVMRENRLHGMFVMLTMEDFQKLVLAPKVDGA